MRFDPTREAALKALEAFLPEAGAAYAKRRNTDPGPEQPTAVSRLSPYVRHRLVTEAEVVDRVLSVHPADAADKFIQEVCWRTYWKGWLQLRPDIWHRYQRDVRRLVEQGGSWQSGYADAVAGRTGMACFDAWVAELRQYGYLHNHTRMWFASIWIYTLELPWQLGADFFLRYLLDGDAASNTLSWRWVGGLQTRGKTYLARADNIDKYTGGRFGPVTGLAAEAPPLPWDDPPPPSADFREQLPERDRQTGLVVTDDDLTPWFALDDVTNIAAAATVSTVAARSPGEVGEKPAAFTAAAIEDTGRRLASRLGVDVTRTDDVAAIVAWACAEQLQQVVVAHPPVGPSADHLASLAEQLAAANIGFANPLRAWDRAAWPHATKGFFPFRKQIPALLGYRTRDAV